jgi:hypothetical protein
MLAGAWHLDDAHPVLEAATFYVSDDLLIVGDKRNLLKRSTRSRNIAPRFAIAHSSADHASNGPNNL